MKIRLLSGSVYVALLVAFYCLKVFLPQPYGDFAFDVLLYAFAWIGTFEMLRAMQGGVTKKEKAIVFAFTAVSIPACAFSQATWGAGLQAMCLCLLLLSVALLSLLVIAHDETSLESLGLALLSAVYPAFFISVLVLGNHFTPTAKLAELGVNSKLFVLFVFVISPSADSFAYLFGRFLRKTFPQKMAPKLSPNKTVIGGVGGLVGGIVGAVALYFIYTACANVPVQTATCANTTSLWLPIYIMIGLIGSAVTEFGDLVESCIKRKLGLKDMGKIMPGHGGVLDRLDSVMFTAISTYLLFLLLCVIF